MASSNDNISMAVFCDFENVALGVRDANYEKFDIKPVLERLLLKGSIVVKKAYCDWERYKGFKATMHEANFELIEIPHVRQSGKNSADIRLVVDALDLCYTKSHVNTFVIISGDSDFSPLVSKLRENAKQVIGVGVKQSTSDLLVANCDEFIFYDDLVREVKRTAAKRDERKQSAPRRSADEGNRRKEEMEARKAQAIELVVEMFDALVSERGDSGKIWASLLKDTLKRRRPDFNETYYGFRTFGNLLEEAQSRGMLEFGRDEKSGAYVYRSTAAVADAAQAQSEQSTLDDMQPEQAQADEQDLEQEQDRQPQEPAQEQQPARTQQGREPRRGRGRGGRSQGADEQTEQPKAQQQPKSHVKQERPPKADNQRGRGRGGRNQEPLSDLQREQLEHHRLEQQRERERERDEREQYETTPEPVRAQVQPEPQESRDEPAAGGEAKRGRGRGGRKQAETVQADEQPAPVIAPVIGDDSEAAPVVEKRRTPRKAPAKRAAKSTEATQATEAPAAPEAQSEAAGDAPQKKPARARRPAKKAAE